MQCPCFQVLAFCEQHGLDRKKHTEVKYCKESIAELNGMARWKLYVFKAYVGRPPAKGSVRRYYPRLWAALEARKPGGVLMSEEEVAALH